MGTSKAKTNAYVPKALEAFRKYLIKDRQRLGKVQFRAKQISIEGLEEAIKTMPKEDKENIEKFWGLTGGVNHSKMIGHRSANDIAFINLRNRAHASLRKLSRLDFVEKYDNDLNFLIERLAKKIDKEGYSHISDLESIKYLMAYFIIVENGPKMSFEKNPMVVEKNVDNMSFLDEYQALHEMYQQIEKLPDKCIKMALIIGVFEMMDLRDAAAVQQSFGIQIPKDTRNSFLPNEIETIQTFGQIRNFKERVFKYGAWDVTSTLILGEIPEIEDFAKELSILCRDWSKMKDFKTGQKQLRTSRELLTLDVYNIGGLEFTDTYEIEFLYLMRRFI